MDAIDNAIATRGLVRIGARNGRKSLSGVVGIALGYNAQYHTVKIGFIDAEGNYTGEKTVIGFDHVEVVEISPVSSGGFCGACGQVFTLAEALNSHQRLTGHEMNQPDNPAHTSGAWFVEQSSTEATPRFGPKWFTEAGPFKTERAGEAWLTDNSHRLPSNRFWRVVLDPDN